MPMKRMSSCGARCRHHNRSVPATASRHSESIPANTARPTSAIRGVSSAKPPGSSSLSFSKTEGFAIEGPAEKIAVRFIDFGDLLDNCGQIRAWPYDEG